MTKKYKYILLTLIIIGSFNIKLSATNPILVRQMEVVKDDTLFVHHFIYNENNQKTIDTQYIKIDNKLIRKNQTEWIYSDEKCIEQRLRKWTQNNWEDFYIIRYNYDNNKKSKEIHRAINDKKERFIKKTNFIYSEGKLISKTNFQWINSVWVETQKINYTYTLDGLTKTNLFSIYENGTIKNKSKIEYTYSDKKQLVTITKLVQKDDNWLNQKQTVFYYDNSTNKKVLEITKSWNNKHQIWVNQQNTQYQYDANQNIIESNYQYWAGLFWKNDVKYTYIYNKDNQLITKNTYLPIYNDYRLISQINYTDFLHDKASIIKSKYQFWGGETNAPNKTSIPFQFNNKIITKNASKVKISYTPFQTDISTYTSNSSKKTIDVYPNPSTGIFYFNNNGSNVYSWIITDINGRILLENKNPNHSQIIDLGDFNKEIYLLQINTANGKKTQKLIKI